LDLRFVVRPKKCPRISKKLSDTTTETGVSVNRSESHRCGSTAAPVAVGGDWSADVVIVSPPYRAARTLLSSLFQLDYKQVRAGAGTVTMLGGRPGQQGPGGRQRGVLCRCGSRMAPAAPPRLPGTSRRWW